MTSQHQNLPPLVPPIQQQIQPTIEPPIPLPPLLNTINQAPPPYITPTPNLYVNLTSNEGHKFPVLCNQLSTEQQPMSLYSEYVGNVYNIFDNVNSTRVNYETDELLSNFNTNHDNVDNLENQTVSTTENQTVENANIFQSSNYFSTSDVDFITSEATNDVLNSSSNLIQNIPVSSNIISQ